MIPAICRWPWSVGIEDESYPLDEDGVEFHFLGSPVLILPHEAKILLPERYERFFPLGPCCTNGNRVYEAPHGVLSHGRQASNQVMIFSNGRRKLFPINAIGARPRTREDGKKETYLARIVLGWSQIFDNMMEIKAKTKDCEPETGGQREKIPWKQVLALIKEQKEERGAPRRSLIVSIAESQRKNLAETVLRMRRILLRARDMQRVNRIKEMDLGCLQWFVRQPGASHAEKAGSRQELLAVVRRESFDVLENRVLKDFLRRCALESMRYIINEVDINPNFKGAPKALRVFEFRRLCMNLLDHPGLQTVPLPGSGVRPNYVLQNDARYRQIWAWYSKLLRREDDEDRLWDWQARTWADIVRMFVNLAIDMLHKEDGMGKMVQNGFGIEEIFGSSLHVIREQILGCRTASGSEPGPYVVKRISHGRAVPVAILEVVHPDQGHMHDIVKHFGRTGGHLYLVVRPLENALGTTYVIIVWAVNTAGSDQEKNWTDISMSASAALKKHGEAIRDRGLCNELVLDGLVIANSLSMIQEADVKGLSTSAPVFIIPSDVLQWRHHAIEFIATRLLERLNGLR
ncbi:hypothetical protein SAMN02746065_10651 [Desulfocicer vacuolatum DSM 3385]|uniref:DUF2357 domain-containing protein n=1 Tax=Desulfocicer vacuolatum DSM 3385 TaxID=1121400 RepID=A0A1W2ARK4_9BACT|nr:hypothetical protein [Desulfocicer vacuolatum]SMC63369.1 hypothetical protein SAMN02746065_10651 [Desulfocicer vacuolatum DSM 3385]